MATPTNLPTTFVAGDILTAAQQNALRGAFRVLQVVNATTATSASTVGTTYIDSNLTATITCQSNTSKVLVITSQVFFSTGGRECNVRLVAGATTLQTDPAVVFSAAGSVFGNNSFLHLHSPASTSAITYKTQFTGAATAGTVAVQLNGTTSSITLLEISA
jgi:hypothetical protein